jgi:Asp-tRNA(Asn)/Glu-tRNA(Gln) amidotransferase A subunit family amidase
VRFVSFSCSLGLSLFQNLPLGLQLIGNLLEEDLLLSVASVLEATTAPFPPSIHSKILVD